MQRQPRNRCRRWILATAVVLALLFAIDLASGRWLFSWGLLGHSGEVWDGKLSIRRESDEAPPRQWSLVRAGVKFQVRSHLTCYFHASWAERWSVATPIWSLAAAAAAPCLCLVAFTLCVRLRRRSADLCRTCGYDLVGLPGPRCPECGELV